MIVVGILGVLTVGLLTTLNPIEQIKKGRDTQRKSDLSQIQKSLETYYQDNGRYPGSSVNNKIIPQGSGTVEVDWGDPWVPYMSRIPKDPNSSRNYVYLSTGQTYHLYASLERGEKDPQACRGISNQCSNVPSGVFCGESNDKICNYGVTSPNTIP